MDTIVPGITDFFVVVLGHTSVSTLKELEGEGTRFLSVVLCILCPIWPLRLQIFSYSSRL